jgi:hypothetical protein
VVTGFAFGLACNGQSNRNRLVSALNDLTWLSALTTTGMQLPSLKPVHFGTDLVFMG